MQVTKPNTPTKKSKSKPVRADCKIDITKLQVLRCKGLTEKELASYFGVTGPAIHELLHRYLPDITGNQAKDILPDLTSRKAVMALASLSAEKLENASAKDAAIVAGALTDKFLALTGRSQGQITVNINFSGPTFDASKPEVIDITPGSVAQFAMKD